MHQFKYLIHAYLILLCLIIGVRLFSIVTSQSSSSKKSATEPTVFVLESKLSPGRALYQQNCASCHRLDRNSATAPSLTSVLQESEQWSDDEKLKLWIRNPAFYKDRYTDQLKEAYGYIMPGFPHLSEQEIDDIMSFLRLHSSQAVVIAK